MNAILDIIIVTIAASTIYFAVKNGFIKTLLSASAFFIAVIITISLTNPLKNAFMSSSAADSIRDRVETTISGVFEEKEDAITKNTENNFQIDAVFSDKGGMNELFGVLEKFGVDKNELKSQVNKWKAEKGVDLKQKLVEYIADPIVNAIASIIIISLLFFGSLILLKITAYVLNKLCMLPVLKTANKLLGLILGILLALIRIYFFCIITKAFIPYGQTLDIGWLAAIDPEKTLIFKLFYEYNVFSFLMGYTGIHK